MTKDLYATLGVAKTASDADVKKAYRKLAKELHPDHNRDNPKALERFKNVTAAYNILSEPDKRGQYDRGEINADGQPQHFSSGFAPGGGFGSGNGHSRAGAHQQRFEFNAEDIFADLFTGQRGFGASRPKGADVAYTLSVPFEAGALGHSQRLTLKSGKIVDIKIPPGFTDGQQMRLAGQGAPGPGGAGDALVSLKLASHPHFHREGDDIRLDFPISLFEAVHGAKVKVPTVDGSVLLTIPKGSTSGKMLRLRGKGFSTRAGGRGDQLLTLLIDIPTNDDAFQKFVKGWKSGQNHNPRAGTGLE